MVAYIDGACSGNPGPGGFGIIMLDKKFGVLRINGGKQQTTNNEMELTALMRLLEICAGAPLYIHTDSMYVINCFYHHSEWIKKDKVPNKDIVERVHDLLNARKKEIKIIKVKGHSNDYWNDEADELAKFWIENHKMKDLNDEEKQLQDMLCGVTLKQYRRKK